MSEAELETIRHALELARERGFGEVKLSTKGSSFTATLERAKKAPAVTTAQTEPTELQAVEEALLEVKSSLVGYLRPGTVKLEVGQTIKSTDMVASIVALGMANPVEAGVSGEVVEVLVNPDEPVMYGQVIAKVRAAK